MYVITFYSFKGGVGRTMALANVALELCRARRNVLLVDFDLEAPGLDTFDILKPTRPTAGIVDYVTCYRQTGAAPPVSDFIYEPKLGGGLPGRLWVMPTGKQDEGYASRLNNIDWQQLYSEQDGYILFEDLKAQWQQKLNPDYVLIDSRTGHTDVGGICTRQLPAAVVIFFYPNEQNRRGIDIVVRDIRKENREAKRSVSLYFVASNVPDLDDEERILRNRLDHFRRTLGCPRLDGTIHHYDSLSLLQQTVFTVERPQTKLASEYRHLANRIIFNNLGDRRVVLDSLAGLSRGVEHFQPDTIVEIDARLREIQALYCRDGEVLHSLAQANQSLGRSEVAISLFSEARSLGFETADALIDLAVSAYNSGSNDEARGFLKTAVERSIRQVFKLERAFKLALERDIVFLTELVQVLDLTAIRPVDRIHISKLLATQDGALEAVERLLTPIMQSAVDAADLASAEYELALCWIAQGRFEEAMKLIAPERSLLVELGIGENFNYAMAEWGVTHRVPVDLFHRILLMHKDSPRDDGANYHQCLAIAFWAVGRADDSKDHIELSRQALIESERTFSAWRYLYVDNDEFRQDLAGIEKMALGGEERPQMFQIG